MKPFKPCMTLVTVLLFGTFVGCSGTSSKSAEVSDSASAEVSATIRKSLDQADLKAVSASQDRTTGTVTLGGQVELNSDKTRAESIAISMAGGKGISNQIAVMGAGHMGEHGPGRMMESGPGHMGQRGRDQMPEKPR